MPNGIDTDDQTQTDQSLQPQASRMGAYLAQTQAQPQQPAAQSPAPTQPAAPAQPVARPGYKIQGGQEVPLYINPGKFTNYENTFKDRNIEHKVFMYGSQEDAAAH